jgi:hypothetical protein
MSAAPAPVAPTPFSDFLNKILNIFLIDESIKNQIIATMEKLNIPDKIKFMTNLELENKLLDIDLLIKKNYDTVKQHINDAIWIEFLKNIIQLQVLVFLKKVPLDELIKPFESALNSKVEALVSAKNTEVAKAKYLKYKKKYLQLK